MTSKKDFFQVAPGKKIIGIEPNFASILRTDKPTVTVPEKSEYYSEIGEPKPDTERVILAPKTKSKSVIIELVEYWAEYRAEQQDPGLINFLDWLKDHKI
jgi:hypothetical protein